MTWDKEHARIVKSYQSLDESLNGDAVKKRRFFTYRDYAHVIRLHERFWETQRLLDQNSFSNFSDLIILDIGCGNGYMLRQFLQWGACPEKLAGIELRSEEVQENLALSPNIDIRLGSAVALPWVQETFDLVCQHTVFTSILDPSMKRQVAQEMARVLRPGGAILWYDFQFDNPHNPHVRGVKAAEIRSLFRGFNIHLQRITLAPPLARRIPPRLLPTLYPLLAFIPYLRTHYLGLFVKPTT